VFGLCLSVLLLLVFLVFSSVGCFDWVWGWGCLVLLVPLLFCFFGVLYVLVGLVCLFWAIDCAFVFTCFKFVMFYLFSI
jgi:hypothetical protein